MDILGMFYQEFLYTFLRLIYLSNEIEILGYPLDYNSYLMFTMNSNISFNNILLDDSFNSFLVNKKILSNVII